jgi:hypothetical protein
MGMAASQARFLQLTARRTNIEYMGQQINQQRLALANASAGLFEKMLSMVPPTPPSSQDDKYYKQGYKFTDVADGIQKSISWSTTTPAAANFYGGGAASTSIVGTTGGAASTFTVSNANLALAAASPTNGALTPSVEDLAIAMGVNPSAAQTAMGYVSVIRNVSMEHTYYDPDGTLQTKTVTAPALLVFDNLNRLISFTSFDQATMDAQDTATTNKVDTVSGDGLVYGGTFDDTAYNDDMNKYEFDKSTYDYQIERINQETRIIQSQDRSLELKMKQLDTEHTAVQTEMEAVQKVLQTNIEGSFKTFA